MSYGIHDRFQEASEYIKDMFGFRTYGKLKATFMQAGLDEDVKPSYILEEDWSFLIRRASALYMDFQRVRSSLTSCFILTAAELVGYKPCFTRCGGLDESLVLQSAE